MVPSAEFGPNTQERDIGLGPHQEHRDLARHDDRLVPLLALQGIETDSVVVGHGLDDALGGDLALLRVVQDVREDRLGELDRDRHGAHRRVGDDPVQRALELPDVADDLAGDELDDVRRDRDGALLGLRAEDRDPGLKVRGREVGDQAPLEPASEALLEAEDPLGRPIRAEHDLLAVLVDRVERMEELFLGPFLVRDELDVIDQEEIDPAIAGSEFVDLALLDRGDELVGELLRRGVHDALPRELRHDLVADGVHEVGLAEPDPAIQEERVVGVPGALGDREACRMSQAIGRADDEVGKGIASVQVG